MGRLLFGLLKMTRDSQEFDYILPSPIGNLGLSVSAKGIRCLSYMKAKEQVRLPRDGLAKKVFLQLQEYFELRRTSFNLPIDIVGTKYQNKVWTEVATIAYGESRTYGDIAQSINSGPRAVGNACRRNPIPIIIPCHRVVKKSGLGGYCGSVVGKEIQQKDWLLRHEIDTDLSGELFYHHG